MESVSGVASSVRALRSKLNNLCAEEWKNGLCSFQGCALAKNVPIAKVIFANTCLLLVLSKGVDH